MSKNQKYWKGSEELERTSDFLKSQKHEFSDALPLDEVLSEEGIELNSNRRDFLKFFGFSVTSVALAACYRTPVRHAVPYLVKPNEVTPGVPNYYSSTCGACSSACGVEVKVREGRPIKLDGSLRSPISQGGLCATGQASILDLYDTERLAHPMQNGKEVEDWNTLDIEIAQKISEVQTSGKKIVILSDTVHSPSALKAVADFKAKYSNVEHVSYNAVSYSSIIEANEADFGKAVLPSYNFEKASVIVSFGADFLGTWISPVEFTKGYVKNRVPVKGKEMSQHFQFESNLSTTGTNADYRFPMQASKEALYLSTLYNEVAKLKGAVQIPVPQNGELAGNSVKRAAKALVKAGSAALVVSGSSSKEAQQIVNGLNALLGSIGNTITFDAYSKQFDATQTALNGLKADIKSKKVGGIIFWGTNPVYSNDKGFWTEAIKGMKLSVSFAGTKDETASLCTYICPDNHFLESWGDAEPKNGHVHFVQPTIAPVFNTRQSPLSLLVWAQAIAPDLMDPFQKKGHLAQKHHTSPYYSYVKETWASAGKEFDELLHDGYYSYNTETAASSAYSGNVAGLASYISKTSKSTGVDLVLYTSVGVNDGSHGNNAWVQELPDPVSKVTWDNYVSLPKALAEKMGVDKDDTVTLEVNGQTLANVPSLIQPGQANNTIGLAIGYGRWAAGKVGGSNEKGYDVLGVNAYPLIGADGNTVINGVKISKGDDSYELAQTQSHHSIEGRDIVRETTQKEWQENAKAGNDKPAPHIYTIWEKQEYRKDGAPNHLWSMAIDLNACTGCGSCVVSCSIENNVPVVGRDEIRLRREMHWIRIDRYYSFHNDNKDVSDENYLTEEKVIAKADKADKAEGGDGNYEHWENVKVVHQPMMCQHCSQAPCETVCPVLATTHSSEGLNQMTYNRCIGTKYCGNNCPYKVRRFNWFRYNDNDAFDFHFNNPLGKMVMNPDVTVRTRGVMEKCSFCVQRLQAGKLEAKRKNKTMAADAVQTACQRACPADAIVFGDLHNPDSEISMLAKNERGYKVLEELNVQSSVTYLTKVRNIDQEA